MHVPKRDLIATSFVIVATGLYLLWASDAALPGMRSTRMTGLVILALGFAASASAVVPSFQQLLHGNRAYVVVTSLIGLVALIGGVVMLLTSSDGGLAVLMLTMAALWLIATVHHAMEARASVPRPSTPSLVH